MSINLFISLYPEKDKARAKELAKCLKINADNQAIDQIFILVESRGHGFDYLSTDFNLPANVEVLPCSTRPTFRTFFNAINVLSAPNDINIIANSDIYFDAIPAVPGDKQCFALTRYDIQKDGIAKFLNRQDSQDSWMFKGYVNLPKYCDFWLGVRGCDNRISRELAAVGYDVINPSLTIKTYHLHANPTVHGYDKIIKPPYLRLTPIAL